MGVRMGMCSWCHAGVPIAVRLCRRCGHQAHVPRMDCGCPACVDRRPLLQPVKQRNPHPEEESDADSTP